MAGTRGFRAALPMLRLLLTAESMLGGLEPYSARRKAFLLQRCRKSLLEERSLCARQEPGSWNLMTETFVAITRPILVCLLAASISSATKVDSPAQTAKDQTPANIEER